ncbi:4Fe-4S dicluster domain-containing protein [Bacillota bacterium LX-D]|nr:4Fe-4S dicluster domain-containing protein [Bacillota bacterium LX-D]
MKQILVRTERCLGCKSCELTCSTKHSRSKNLYGAVLQGEKPVRRVTVETNGAKTLNLPIQCRQCQDPRCVSACMTGAMQLDQETNLVVNKEEKCVGCWMCVMVCPYGAITPDEKGKTAVKCDQCLAEGHDPACVQACPTKAIQFVEITDFDKLTHKAFLTRFTSGEEA